MDAVGEVSGKKVRTRAKVPSGFGIMNAARKMATIAGTVTITDIRVASLTEVVAAPIEPISAANTKYTAR